MSKFPIIILASAFIGETVPLLLLYLVDVLPRVLRAFGSNDLTTLNYTVTLDYIKLTLWPSSIFLALTSGPDRSRDGEMLAISIIFNASLCIQ